LNILEKEAIQVNEFVHAVRNGGIQTGRESCHIELLTGVHNLTKKWKEIAVATCYNDHVVRGSVSGPHDVNDDLDVNIPSLLAFGWLLEDSWHQLSCDLHLRIRPAPKHDLGDLSLCRCYGVIIAYDTCVVTDSRVPESGVRRHAIVPNKHVW
jgi:hypothetical protein